METAVVTGAASGIGKACVEAFRGRGLATVGVDVRESSSADEHLQIDLSQPDCGDRLAEGIGVRRIDVLVNNAAIGLNKAATEITTAEFDEVIAVNLRAPFLLAATLHDALASVRGSVVNVASVHAIATSQQVAAYAASKGGLVAMTRALAVEWAPDVRVNAVLPGAIDTEMLAAGLSRTDSALSELASRHPLGRVGQPEEIAEAVLFLAESGFMTGSVVVVDGGATSRLATE